jgi:hypothetical protein
MTDLTSAEKLHFEELNALKKGEQKEGKSEHGKMSGRKKATWNQNARLDTGWDDVKTGWSHRTTNIFTTLQGKTPKYLNQTAQGGNRKILTKTLDMKKLGTERHVRRGHDSQQRSQPPTDRGRGRKTLDKSKASSESSDEESDTIMETLVEVDELEDNSQDEMQGDETEQNLQESDLKLDQSEEAETQGIAARDMTSTADAYKTLLKDLTDWRHGNYITKVTIREIKKVFPNFIVLDGPPDVISPILKPKPFLQCSPSRHRRRRLSASHQEASVDNAAQSTHPLLSHNGSLLAPKKHVANRPFDDTKPSEEEYRHYTPHGTQHIRPVEQKIHGVLDTFDIKPRTKLPDLLPSPLDAPSEPPQVSTELSKPSTFSLPTLELPTHNISSPLGSHMSSRGFRPVPRAIPRHSLRAKGTTVQKVNGVLQWNRIISLSLSDSVYSMKNKPRRRRH